MALDASNREGEPWIQATAKCCFGLGGHEEALGAGKLKRAIWVRANTRDALGADKLEGMFLDTGR